MKGGCVFTKAVAVLNATPGPPATVKDEVVYVTGKSAGGPQRGLGTPCSQGNGPAVQPKKLTTMDAQSHASIVKGRERLVPGGPAYVHVTLFMKVWPVLYSVPLPRSTEHRFGLKAGLIVSWLGGTLLNLL